MELIIWSAITWLVVGLVSGVVGIWSNKLQPSPVGICMAVVLGPFFAAIWAGEWWEVKRLRSAIRPRPCFDFWDMSAAEARWSKQKGPGESTPRAFHDDTTTHTSQTH